jgi:hypothetical protein
VLTPPTVDARTIVPDWFNRLTLFGCHAVGSDRVLVNTVTSYSMIRLSTVRSSFGTPSEMGRSSADCSHPVPV